MKEIDKKLAEVTSKLKLTDKHYLLGTAETMLNLAKRKGA